MAERGHIAVEVEDAETSSRSQHPHKLGDGSFSSWHVGQHRHAHHGVECSVGERQLKGTTFAELNAMAEARLSRQFAGHGQQRRTRVDSNGQPMLADTSGDLASNCAAAAADVENALARSDAE